MKYVHIMEIITIRFSGIKNFVFLLLIGEQQSKELFKF